VGGGLGVELVRTWRGWREGVRCGEGGDLCV